MTLVDTPGFSSGQAEVNAKEDDVLDRRTRQAAANCDAVVFVLNQTLRADDVDVLRSFQEAQLGPSSAVNLRGCVDEGGQARERIRRPPGQGTGACQTVLRATLSLTSLRLYRWSDSGPRLRSLRALDEQDVAGLIRLAEMDGEALGRILASVDRFRTGECPIDPGARAKLLDRLDLHGIRLSIALVADGARSAEVPQARTVPGVRDRTPAVQRFCPEVCGQERPPPPSLGPRGPSRSVVPKGDANHVRTGPTGCGREGPTRRSHA